MFLLFSIVVLIGKLFRKFKSVSPWVAIFFGIIGLIGVSFNHWAETRIPKKPTQQIVDQGFVEESPPSFSVEELFNLTNERRVEADRKPLLLDPVLNDSAQRKCEDMVATGIADHNLQELRNLADNLNRAIGENLAEGYFTSASVITAWDESPTHRENLLDSDWRRIGFGLCDSHSLGPIVVQHFSN